METKQIIIGILIILLIIVSVSAFVLYIQKNSFKSENEKLNSNIVELNTDKNKVIDEREQCRVDLQNINSELSMLKDDVFQLKKSCITNNACKGQFPSVRWKCNAQGDAVDNGDKICVCNENCELQVS